LIKERQVIKER